VDVDKLLTNKYFILHAADIHFLTDGFFFSPHVYVAEKKSAVVSAGSVERS